jgi:hypothetical protein
LGGREANPELALSLPDGVPRDSPLADALSYFSVQNDGLSDLLYGTLLLLALASQGQKAGADPKSVQGQMHHSRISTTMKVYAHIVPLAQRRALEQLSEFATKRSITVQ